MMNSIFENTQAAFALKTDSDLDRAYFLFKMIDNEPLVKIGTAVTNFAIKAHLPVEGLIRASVFDHFCGGVNEYDCLPVVEKMFSKGVYSVLDYSVEGKEDDLSFDGVVEKTIKIIGFAKAKQAMPFAVFKPTGLGRFALYEKKSKGEVLSDKEQKEWEVVTARFHKICQFAHDNQVAVLIDGEESWMQDAADELVELMMQTYNKEQVIVYNTLQLYRWDRLDYLKKLQQRALAGGFKIGMKLVRGAYMEKENKRAKDLGYPSPICANKKVTDDNFDTTLAYMLNHLDVMSLFIGTHNEDSVLKTLSLMQEKGIAKDNPSIWFGQLYGMSDHISFNLSAEDYLVAKYVPFGPVRDVMPYLIRRAEENTSVAGQTSRELTLIKAERKRRKLED